MARIRFTRRQALIGTAATGAVLAAPGLVRAAARPSLSHGVQSGDIAHDGAVIWARADGEAAMAVEWATTESFADARRLPALPVGAATDNTGKMALTGLPADQDVFYRVRMESLTEAGRSSEPVTGHFRTAPMGLRDVRFVWSGDTAGQGWGIDESRGGMTIYRAMAGHRPDFMIHSGDTIYADGPLAEEVELKDGTTWRNIVTPSKAKVAETLDEFRGNHLYNRLDANVLDFTRDVPVMVQWDDHEVVNNWYPGEVLEDDRYGVKDVNLLAARAARAFHEMNPVRRTPSEPRRVYRKVAYGPLLDVFFLDMRTYRGPNGANDQVQGAPFLGRAQMEWLKRELTASTATWKAFAADMPIGMIVYDDWRTKSTFENGANGDGPVLGREADIAELLGFLQQAGIRNTAWLTADVHYTAAHHYSPERAQFQDFDPFWEFVSGPLHAGTFGPNDYDNTFGPDVRFARAPTEAQGINLPPSEGLQFFGMVDIAADTGVMTVRLMDAADTELWRVDLEPASA